MSKNKSRCLAPSTSQHTILTSSPTLPLPSSHTHTLPTPTPISNPQATSNFPIATLPAELRLKIYTLYLSSLAPITITPMNANASSLSKPQSKNPNIHTLLTTPLRLSSLFFTHDIPSSYIYQNCTFLFTSGEAMRTFATVHANARKNVRNIIISSSPQRKITTTETVTTITKEGEGVPVHRDWVFLMNSCFENLESVVFTCMCVGQEGFGNCECCERRAWSFESWWDALVDAVREGRGGESEKGKRRGQLVLSSWIGGKEAVFVC